MEKNFYPQKIVLAYVADKSQSTPPPFRYTYVHSKDLISDQTTPEHRLPDQRRDNEFQNMRKCRSMTKPTKWSVHPAKTQIMHEETLGP